MVPASGGQADAKGQIANPADADELPDVRGDLKSAMQLSVVRDILAELPSGKWEVIELSLQYGLHDGDLARAPRMSPDPPDALAARTPAVWRGPGWAPIIAPTMQQVWPELDPMLTDRDGRLIDEVRNLIGGHAERCRACAACQ